MTLKETILDRLQKTFPDARMKLVDTTGTNDHWDLQIASDQFIGLNRVKRHQAVYKPLKDLIASNQVHALNIKAVPLEEWDQ